jgi:GTPase SAR1 family protein
MSTSDHFLLALQAYQEIRQELKQQEEPVLKTIHEPMEGRPNVDGSLMIGLAEDGLPLNLNLYDPHAGPLLVAGDARSGKTTFLQSIATSSADLLDVQFGVLTPFPEEWRGHESLPNCMGIWPAQHSSAGDFLAQIAYWAEALPKTRQIILVLVDNFEMMSFHSTVKNNFRWLCVHGPEFQVWPVVAINPTKMTTSHSLLEQFQTRILGRITRYNSACMLSGVPPLDLNGLIPGMQFFFTSTQVCTRFWLPPAEGVSYERGNAMV